MLYNVLFTILDDTMNKLNSAPVSYGHTTFEPTRNTTSAEQEDSCSDFALSNTWGSPDDKDKVGKFEYF